jgi:hypothetical protein
MTTKGKSWSRWLAGAAIALALATGPALADDTLDRGVDRNGPRWTRR